MQPNNFNYLPIINNNILVGPPLDYPREGLHYSLWKRFENEGDAFQIIDSRTGETPSNAEIYKMVKKVMSYFQKIGLKKSDVICFCSENRLEFLSILVAALFLGVIFFPINPLYTPVEMSNILKIAQPSLTLCSNIAAKKIFTLDVSVTGKHIVLLDNANEDLPTSGHSVTTWNHVLSMEPFHSEIYRVWDLDDTALLFCSSGTTGVPKCIELTYRNITATISSINLFYEPHQCHTVLAYLPLFHCYGFCAIIGTFLRGNINVVMSHFSEKVFLESIQKYKVTLVPLVPTLLHFMAYHPSIDQYDLSSITRVLVGAAPCALTLLSDFHKRFKYVYVLRAYGMTETTVVSTHTPPNSTFLQTKPKTSGVPQPGSMIKVVSEDGKTVPPYIRGEICVKGPMVMKGYLKNPEITAKTIDAEGWLHTGDVGYYDREGYLYIEDRLKELIKYKAMQVSPVELEEFLQKHPEIHDVAIIGKPDEVAGELPMAFVVKAPNSTITAEEIGLLIKKSFSSPKWLRGGVQFVKAIPKSVTGKILRKELRLILNKKSNL